MRRNELTSCIALGAFVILAAICALRFDLASLLLPDVPASAEVQRAAAMKRVSAGGAAALDLRPVEDGTGKSASSTFDVVRIDPDGASVFAGRAPANASVTVSANEKPVATAKANEDGQWAAVIDRQFAPGEYQLSLTAKPSGTGTQLSGQSVRITIASSARPTPADVKVAAPLMPAPAPITFPYDEASVTAAGRQQAAALSDFLRQRKLDVVTLSGHADERGSDEYNMQLSRNRLESVARFLRDTGYAGKLVLLPKGKTEPVTGIDRGKLSKEDAFQLDRRVELRLAR
ncbi:MAG: OmpA family protein [Alphaproteobacteria bacterium]|nr:MAG: OmpA family protein [Alphaproteobacteria bacterium]